LDRSKPKSIPGTAVNANYILEALRRSLINFNKEETFTNMWEGAIRTITQEDFATAFRRCEKCVQIADSYVEKSQK
jgi:hypothetical protein